MQNIAEDEGEPVQVPVSNQTKTISRLNNTRYLNQNIYNAFLQKRYKECLTLIERSRPDEFKIYICFLIERNSYRLDKCLELLNECLLMNRLNYAYLKAVAKNYYLMGKYKSSLEVAKDAIKINPNDHEIFYILGKICLAINDKSTAIQNFKTSIAREPNLQCYLQLAKICSGELEYIQATDYLKESLNVSNENPEVFELMGIFSNKMGKNQNAYESFKRALEVDAQRYNSLIGMGAISLERNEVEQALETFKKAFKASPNSAVLWNNIGIAMILKNKLVAAYSCFKRALFLDPFRWDIHANIALTFIKKGKYLPAEIHIRSALGINRDATLFNLLGVCLCELNDLANAQKSFEEAIKMQPQNEQFSFNLLACLLKRGTKQKAQQLFNSLSRNCNNTIVREKLLSFRGKF